MRSWLPFFAAAFNFIYFITLNFLSSCLCFLRVNKRLQNKTFEPFKRIKTEFFPSSSVYRDALSSYNKNSIKIQSYSSTSVSFFEKNPRPTLSEAAEVWNAQLFNGSNISGFLGKRVDEKV